MIPIKQGLDLPVPGAPVQEITTGPVTSRLAVVGDDYVGLKPSMEVAVGDVVRRGGRLFTDRRNPGVVLTAPASGTVIAINRGEKRVFQSLVIECCDANDDRAVEFPSVPESELESLGSQQIRETLVDSGLWPAFRQRPFGVVPAIDSVPASLFVTAIDTNPLAADPSVVLASCEEAFVQGLRVLVQLVDGPRHLVTGPTGSIPGTDLPGFTHQVFSGPHPAGLPGTHMHFLEPVDESRVAWHIGYQDVVAIGRLFVTGGLTSDRVVSLAGPAALRPRLVKTRWGASLEELLVGEADDREHRVISGSVLSGRHATGALGYLGRRHQQVSLLHEGRERVLLGWQRPGGDKFSVTRAFLGSALHTLEQWLGRSPRVDRYKFTTALEGSSRAMIPIGSYERVMPLDLLATHLLRALIVGDTERAKELGCLELGEEDLALCTYVCPGKYDYGNLLRENLEQIQREG